MKIVKFNPEFGFYKYLLDGSKVQTIRDKPMEVGTEIELWQADRGKIKDAKIIACIPMKMCYIENEQENKLLVRYSETFDIDEVPYNKYQSPIVKRDTPNMNNKQFIDLFLKLYPLIKIGWFRLWIWKW